MAPGNAKLRSMSGGDHDFWPGEFTWCPHCRFRLAPDQVGGLVRMVCSGCGFVHFRNPGVGVAGVAIEGGRILMVERGPSSTRAGTWCIPCGYLDYGEEVRHGAAREVQEETGLVVDVGEVIWVASNFHDPAKLTVGIWFECEVIGGDLLAGDDAADARWFPLDQLPELAFETDRRLLETLAERRQVS